MKPAKLLRKKIRSHTLTTGVMVTYHFWPGVVEIAMRAGLDYMIIDFEHMTWDPEAVADACAIGRRENFPILIRPPQAEPIPLRLAADLGPCGMLVPYVESAATMDKVADALLIKPRGQRRVGGPCGYWVKDWSYATWKREVEDNFIIIPQIESRKGLDAADEIARHPLTTALGIGPYDLSSDLGVCWEPKHPKQLAAVERIRKAARGAAKNMWIIGEAVDLQKRGLTFLCIGEPVAIMEGAMAGLVRDLKARRPKRLSAGGKPLP